MNREHPMKRLSTRALAIALIAGLAVTVFLSTSAKSQIQISPNYLPMGVASTGAASTAWFHEPSTRQVLACQTTAAASGSLSGIQCVAAKLP
jgi:hypothetical protein